MMATSSYYLSFSSLIMESCNTNGYETNPARIFGIMHDHGGPAGYLVLLCKSAACGPAAAALLEQSGAALPCCRVLVGM